MKPKFEYIPRPRAELDALLVEHLDALQSHCYQYDYGKKHFAAEIAVNLRVLLFSQDENKSLLSQLDMESIDFFDSTKTMNEGNPNIFIVPMAGLAFPTTVQSNNEFIEEWEPNTIIELSQPQCTNFLKWWDFPVLETLSGEKFPRRRIIRNTANQDRGAHVAPGIEKAYFDLTRNSKYGGYRGLVIENYDGDPAGYIPPEKFVEVSKVGAGTKLVRALVRQIGHEVLITLLKDPGPYLREILRPNMGLSPVKFLQCMSLDENAKPPN